MGRNGNRSIFERGRQIGECVEQRVERNYDFSHGSDYTVESIIRLKISPIPPLLKIDFPYLLEKRVAKVFPTRFVEIVYRAFYARTEWKETGGEKRRVERRRSFENIRNEERDDATISRTSRTLESSTRFLRFFDWQKKKKEKRRKEKKGKEGKFSIERTNEKDESERAERKFTRFSDCGCHPASHSMAHSIRVEIQWTSSGGHR